MLTHTSTHRADEDVLMPGAEPSIDVDMSWQGAPERRPVPQRTLGPDARLVALLALPFLLASFAWVTHLESRLPQIHRSDAPAETLLYPGVHPLDQPSIETSGGWYWQIFGPSRSLVSDAAGSTLGMSFYGTKLVVTARVGPESAKIYVTVDGAPVPGLPRDTRGTYLSLRSINQTLDRDVVLASGLSYQEHHIELLTAGSGTVAISAVRVVAQSPFPWAFSLVEVSLAAGIFVALRTLGRAIPARLTAKPAARRRR